MKVLLRYNGALTEFTLFGRLPKEIRDDIWDLALLTRGETRVIHCSTSRRIPVPILLHTSNMNSPDLQTRLEQSTWILRTTSASIK
jgi:hypothetical protein